MSDFAALPEPDEESDIRPLPVLAEPREVTRPPEISLPAAVVAAGAGFLAGVATFVLVRILRRPRAATRLPRGRGRSKRVNVAATRSFLVDVHLLRDR